MLFKMFVALVLLIENSAHIYSKQLGCVRLVPVPCMCGLVVKERALLIIEVFSELFHSRLLY